MYCHPAYDWLTATPRYSWRAGMPARMGPASGLSGFHHHLRFQSRHSAASSCSSLATTHRLGRGIWLIGPQSLPTLPAGDTGKVSGFFSWLPHHLLCLLPRLICGRALKHRRLFQTLSSQKKNIYIYIYISFRVTTASSLVQALKSSQHPLGLLLNLIRHD